jgi:hypothetical protein
LKRINVNEVELNESIFKDIEEVPQEENIQSVAQEETTLIKSNSVICSPNKPELTKSFPPPARSSVEFITNWRKNTSGDFRHKFLRVKLMFLIYAVKFNVHSMELFTKAYYF